MTRRYGLIQGLLCGLVIGTAVTFLVNINPSNVEGAVYQKAASRAERVGEININNSTAFIWTFDFEGRRCLWVTQHAGRGGRGGLSCWEKTP